jgi:predicted GNAT family N-acyltransferase
MTGDPNPKSFTVAMQPSPGPDLTLPTPSNPFPPTNPPVFNDAMAIRIKVFVEEQHVPASAETDDDDPRSWQWVIYDGSSTITTPVAVIRLVPPPQAPHELITNPGADASSLPKYDTAHEPYIKLTRVAVLKEYRGLGLGRRLVDEALGWARGHVEEIEEACRRVVGRELRWKGLVLVHAQVQGEKMYERFGFVTDEKMGKWDEEGIEHVGMWKRIDLEPRS